MKLKYIFYGRLIFRILIALMCFWAYLTKSEYLDFSSGEMWFGLWIVWGILVADFILRFIPGKYHPIGMQKHLKRNFIPTEKFEKNPCLTDKDKLQKKKYDKGAVTVLIFYIVLNGLWLFLYCIGVLRPQELFLIMLAYYVGDMICANGFCPFKLIFMKNRCCNVCRIYNWDEWMLILPLTFVPGFYSYSLAAIAVIYTIVWETAYYKHPERFLESCNRNISCGSCNHGMCPKRFPWNK